MDFELNVDRIISRGYSPDEKTKADYGWWETVGLQFKKDTITEMSFSENLQYNKTIASILEGDTTKGDSVVGAFYDWVTDWRTPDSGFTKDSITYYDSLLNDGKIAFDTEGNQTVGEPNDYAKTWWKIKSKGYNPDSFHKEVVERSQQEMVGLSKHLVKSDRTTAEIFGSLAGWAADPTNLSTLAGEIAAYGITKSPIASKTLKGIFKSNLGSKIIDKDTGRKIVDIFENRINGIQRTRMKNAVKMVGKDAWKEYRDFTIALEKQNLQPGVVKEAVLKKLKEGGFQHAEAIEKLVKFNEKKGIADFGADMLFYSGAAYASEAIHQLNTFDWKSQVLPQYTEADASNDMLLSAGIGLTAGILMDGGLQLWFKRKDRIAAEGILAAELAPDISTEVVEGMTKAFSDISEGKDINVDVTQPPVDFSQEFEGLSADKLQQYAKDAENDETFIPIKQQYEKEKSEYETVRQCILGNKPSTPNPNISDSINK